MRVRDQYVLCTNHRVCAVLMGMVEFTNTFITFRIYDAAVCVCITYAPDTYNDISFVHFANNHSAIAEFVHTGPQIWQSNGNCLCMNLYYTYGPLWMRMRSSPITIWPPFSLYIYYSSMCMKWCPKFRMRSLEFIEILVRLTLRDHTNGACEWHTCEMVRQRHTHTQRFTL